MDILIVVVLWLVGALFSIVLWIDWFRDDFDVDINDFVLIVNISLLLGPISFIGVFIVWSIHKLGKKIADTDRFYEGIVFGKKKK